LTHMHFGALPWMGVPEMRAVSKHARIHKLVNIYMFAYFCVV
jgi:hypothetical protein